MAALPRLHLANIARSVDEDPENVDRTNEPTSSAADGKQDEQHTHNDNNTPRRRMSTGIELLAHRGTYADEASIKQDLRFFFMDPVEKWRARKQFPWKLSLQILKIIIVTCQIVMFGDMRMGHVDFVEQTGCSLKHIMIKNWEAGRDIRSYPPNFPRYSVYTVDSFYEHLTFAVQKYYSLNSSTFSTWMYNYPDGNDSQVPPLNMCVTHLKSIQANLSNDNYFIDTTEIRNCTSLLIPESQLNRSDFSMLNFLNSIKFPIFPERMTQTTLSFTLKTIHIRKKEPANLPDCFSMDVSLIFDNTAHSGQVYVDIENVVQRLPCNGAFLYSDFPVGYKVEILLLDIFVLLVCILSLALCLRALIRAQRLKHRTKMYFLTVYEVKLTKDESLMFLNLWYILIFVNDICLIIGTVCKFTLEYKIIGSVLFTFTGMLLGVGTLFVWMGVLRYLGFFSHYNILILTMKRALPNVLRFLICAGLLYMGFLFCGWVVLGPYHMKFRTLQTASACLFALINGDDMFATFTTTSEQSEPVVWFARIYLYIFITLFIYIVLSLFISIIMDAYEVVKDRFQFSEESYLKEFIAQCADTSVSSDNNNSMFKSCSKCPDCWKGLRRRILRKKTYHVPEDNDCNHLSDSESTAVNA